MGRSIDEITEVVIGTAYEVSNNLGFGFLEKVYENALGYELRNQKITVEQQKPLTVMYKGQNIGDYFADLYIEDQVIVELKSVKELSDIHKTQLLNYLKACNKKVGLLINFGKPKVEIKRVVNNY